MKIQYNDLLKDLVAELKKTQSDGKQSWVSWILFPRFMWYSSVELDRALTAMLKRIQEIQEGKKIVKGKESMTLGEKASAVNEVYLKNFISRFEEY